MWEQGEWSPSLCVVWGLVCREVVIVGTILAGLWEA